MTKTNKETYITAKQLIMVLTILKEGGEEAAMDFVEGLVKSNGDKGEEAKAFADIFVRISDERARMDDLEARVRMDPENKHGAW